MVKLLKRILIKYNNIRIILLKTITNAMIETRGMLLIDPKTTIKVSRNSRLIIGEYFRSREGCKIVVRENGVLSIGKKSFFNYNCIVVCRNNIEIGSNVQFGPGVMVFDHDHDYRTEGGIKKGEYTSDTIVIGDNVWIGANTIILKGTIIPDNCVVGAGSVIKGVFDERSLIVQKRITNISKI